MTLTRDDILKKHGVKTVEVEAFGGTVRVRELSAEVVLRMSALAGTEGDAAATVALFPAIVADTVVDDAGERILTEADITSLPASAVEDIQAVAMAAMNLSGIETEAESKNE